MRAALPIAVLCSACAASPRAATGSHSTSRPDGCREVEEGEDLAAALRSARAGEALCLAPGRHDGPIVVDRAVTLWGPRDAVLGLSRPGSAVVITGAGARIAGFTIDGSGGAFDREDAAVHVLADDVTIEDLDIVHPVFGILVEHVHRATVRGNHVQGDAATSMGLRGDTIRLWETDDSTVADNVVEDGRDIVVFYSSRNRITGNRAVRGRYGTHLMFSDDNLIADNRYLEGVVGVFAMYSHGDTLTRNVVADAGAESGMAIGLKDSGNLVVENNVLVRNTTGIYLDDSPNQTTDTVLLRGNSIRMCDVAVSFHTTPHAVELTGNDLADDRLDALLGPGIDGDAAHWHGNYYDDYEGYDLDGDGVGDVPHVARSASEDLIANHPELAFFRGSLVLGALDATARLLPLWQPPALLTDPAPKMAPRDLDEVLDAR